MALEERYGLRVASALKSTFADFDDVAVDSDRTTLWPEGLAKIGPLLKLRPMQFCIFVAELLGRREIQRMMDKAIQIAATSE